ncbi:MAG: hypothetical protein D6807_00185 [Alphaproteobacteria bacterium]|nr:MAG: hypothetical protein D6807_00185 [Alphaproteobacteria bacterium]
MDAIWAVPPLNELFNVAHDRPFSLLFANYSWLLGMAGGLALLWVAYTISFNARSDEGRHPVYKLAMPLAAATIVAGFLNVLAEVRQPSRLIYGYTQGWYNWDTAIIKYGIIILPLFLMTCWWLSFQSISREQLERGIARFPVKLTPLLDFMTLWSRRYSIFDYPMLSRVVIGVMIFFGFFAPLYSAVFLMYEHGVPVWNSPAQALIFIATALAKGAAIFMVFAPAIYFLGTGRRIELRERRPRWLAVAALVVAAVTWFGWMWWISRLGTLPDQQLAVLVSGPYRQAIVWHWEIIGLILPLVLLATPLGKLNVSRWLAGIGILWGSYAIRYFVVVGGQSLNRSGAGYLGATLDWDVVWYTGFSFLFLIGLLALLMLLMSYNLGDRPSLQEGEAK